MVSSPLAVQFIRELHTDFLISAVFSLLFFKKPKTYSQDFKPEKATANLVIY